MQSRNFFAFGPEFNILTDSVFIAQNKNPSAVGPLPPVSEYIITESSDFIITEGGDNLITE